MQKNGSFDLGIWGIIRRLESLNVLIVNRPLN